MPEAAFVPEGQPLSQVERVVDTFVAPSKTFTDIFRSTNWLLPFLLMIVVGLFFSFAVDKKIGFDQVSQTQIEKNPKAEDQMAQLSPQDRARRMQITATITKVVSYGFAVPILLVAALAALGLWATFNFGLGAKTTYSQIFAVWMFAQLPKSLMALLTGILVWAGVGTENFDIRNPIGTNLGYYVPDTSPAIKNALSFFDIFGLWSVFLLIIGTAIIARKTKGQAAAVVLGWWLIILLVSTGFAAVNS
jgi:Yip1 domain